VRALVLASIVGGQFGSAVRGVLPGLPVVIEVSGAAWLLAAVLGLGLEAVSRSRSRLVRHVTVLFIVTVRGIPELVAVVFIYYGLASVVKFTPFESAVLALGIIATPFVAEVYRGALTTIPVSQRDAARSMGLTTLQTQRLIVIPQTARFAFAPMGNIFVALTKTAAITSAVGVPEIVYRGQGIMETSGKLLPATLAICAVYLAFTLPLAYAVRWFGRRLRGRLAVG